MPRITEARDVQDRIIAYLKGLGYAFIPRNDLPGWRDNSERMAFLPTVLRRQLARLNGWPADDPRIAAIMRRLDLLPAALDGNEQFVQALRGQWTAYDPAQQREFNVRLIDYDELAGNEFHFTEEMWFEDHDRRRLDMVVFVNGLPLVLVENKSPRLEDPGLEGFRQVQETYTTCIPAFVRYPVPFVIAATRLEYGPTWNPSVKAFYRWKQGTDAGGHGGRDYGLEGLVNSFFARDTLLRLIRDYTIFYRADDLTQKFLLRPHQMRAVEKIVARVLAAVSDPQDQTRPRTGLEWHTQGSGKTLTMIVAAHLLRRQPSLDNPTLLIVVDRLELEAQMRQNLEAFGLPAVKATSKQHLRELLAADRRGVIVTTIHKFDGMPKAILPRANVVVLVDEAHRSHEGDLGIDLRAALPNACFFGFTGTPVDRSSVGRGTFRTFGSPADANGYHDKYGIDESIEDGTTVPLYYTLVPTKLWLDRVKLDREFSMLLDEFYSLVDEEGAGSQEALSRLLQRADKLLAVLKSPQRVAAIAAYLAQHYQQHVLPLGFKALVVTPDREACMLYKQALDQHLDPAWSVVVYSENPKYDSDAMKALYLDPDRERAVRKDFRDPAKLPKLLIVTEKLLTGYDAPVAYALYLDKPLKDHTLLQAIARVNRPFAGKDNGLVVDFLGVFEDLQRALAFDSQSYQAGIQDLERLREHFAELLAGAEAMLAPINLGQVEGRTERLIDWFFDEELRKPFLQAAKDLADVYLVLAPDPFLRDYQVRHYAVLDAADTLKAHFNPQTDQERLVYQFIGRTEELIRQHIDAYEVDGPLPLYEITGNLADTLRNDETPERVRVINLRRSLTAYIDQHKAANPYLESLAGEVEQILAQLQEQQISAATALAQLTATAEQAQAAQAERQASTLDNVAFSLGMVLRGHLPGANAPGADETVTDALAGDIAAYLRARPGWAYNPAMEQQVRVGLLGKVLQAAPGRLAPQDATRLVQNLLTMYGIATASNPPASNP